MELAGVRGDGAERGGVNSCISSGTTVQEDVDVRGVRRVQLELGVHNADMDLQRVLPLKDMW